jgi:hypothetical protein
MPFGGLELQGPELFEQVLATQFMAGQVLTPGDLQPQKELRKLKAIWGLQIDYSFHVRVVGAAGNASVLQPEFPAGAIDRIRVEGASGKFGTIDPYNVNGPTGFQYFNTFLGFAPSYALVSVNGAAYVNALGPGSTRPANPTAGAATTDYDVVVRYIIPLAPLDVLDPIQQAAFLLDGRDWNPLILHMFLADQSGLFDVKANTTITFGALQGNFPATPGAAGSGGAVAPTGSPRADVHLIRPNLRRVGLENSKAVGSRLVVRTFQPITSTLQSAVLTDGLIARLTVTGGNKARTLRVVIKTGTKTTDNPTSGVGASFGGLSDAIITQPFEKRAGVRIRQPWTNSALKGYFNIQHATQLPLGYQIIDHLEQGDTRTSFNTSELSKDEFTIEGAVPVITANQIGEATEERYLIAA